MRYSIFALIIFLAGCASTGVSHDVQTSPRIERAELLSQYMNYDKSIHDATTSESVNMVREEAIHIGTQAGYYWATSEINNMLTEISHLLDQIDFRPLLFQETRYFIIPPIINKDSGRRIIDQTGQHIRLIDATYFIEQEPRFTLEPPTWRDYLMMDPIVPDRPVEAMLPTNDEERAIWQRGIQDGFNIGVQQAEILFQGKLAHLTLAYQGMIRYHILLEQNMVSEPKVRERYSSVVGGGQRLSIEDSTVSIEVMPQLNSNRYEWDVIPRLPDISHLFPNVIYFNLTNKE